MSNASAASLNWRSSVGVTRKLRDGSRFSAIQLPLSGNMQPQTDQRDEATQHPRPLRPARLRAAWWGWL